MIDFFKPEDFDPLLKCEKESSPLSASIMANVKLEREGRVVYTGSSDVDHELAAMWHENARTAAKLYSKALLIDIKPINKCEHPKESIRAIESGTFGAFCGWICECGARVEPVEFKEVK